MKQKAALRLVDAEVAALYSLRQGAFLRAQVEGDSVKLRGEPLRELCSWLEFLAASLPSRRASQDIGALAAAARVAERSPAAALLQRDWLDAMDGQGLDTVPPQAGREPSPYWRLCTTYTCGLWSLFHILTIAAAEKSAPRSFLGQSGGEITPQLALLRVRGFVANFFGCEECSEHFLRTFDACSLGRCSLRERDGEGAALWLWQAHNGVTRHIILYYIICYCIIYCIIHIHIYIYIYTYYIILYIVI